MNYQLAYGRNCYTKVLWIAFRKLYVKKETNLWLRQSSAGCNLMEVEGSSLENLYDYTQIINSEKNGLKQADNHVFHVTKVNGVLVCDLKSR